MAKVKALSVLEVAIKGLSQGQQIVNVLHYRSTQLVDGDVHSSATPAGILAAIRTHWQTSVLPLLSDSYYVQEYSLKEMEGRDGPLPGPALPDTYTPIYTQTASIVGNTVDDVGTQADPMERTFVACTARKKTGFVGRRNKGSIHFGPLTEAQVAGNEVLLATRASFLTACNNLRVIETTLLEPTSYVEMIVFSKKFYLGPGATAGAGTAPGLDASAVTSFIINEYAGSQSSRKQASGGA